MKAVSGKHLCKILEKQGWASSRSSEDQMAQRWSGAVIVRYDAEILTQCHESFK